MPPRALKKLTDRVESFDRHGSVPYQVFMLGLCLYAVGALAVETLVAVDPDIATILEYADMGVCVFFLLDFLICLHQAKGARWRYFLSWGWLDLLSAVPVLDVARWGRLARAFRLFRALRAMRTGQIVARLVTEKRAESTLLASGLAALVLIVTCSIAVLRFENHADSNITNGGEAIWWAVATITTVGYGDHYPVTAEGRVIASVLMAAGLALNGSLAAFFAAWFLQPIRKRERDRESDMAREIARLRESIEATRS